MLTWDYGIRQAYLAQALRLTHRVKDGESREDGVNVAECRSVSWETLAN